MIRTFLMCLIASISCKNGPTNTESAATQSPPPPRPATSTAKTHETQLGNSNYFIQLPGSFRISESLGKEGQLVYNIIPKDTSSTTYAYIQIIRGEMIGGQSSLRKESSHFTTSYILGKQVEWKVIKGKGGYLWVFTTEDGDFNAGVFAGNHAAVDTLISLVTTLSRK